MDTAYKIIYSFGVILILISLLGGTLFSVMYNSISKSTLALGGIKEHYITSADDKIDDAFHVAKQVERKIDQLKNIFSREELDETKYEKQKNYIIKSSVYDPFVNVMAIVYRIITFFSGILILAFGFIFHLLNGLMVYRDKVSSLESRVYKLEKSFLMQRTI